MHSMFGVLHVFFLYCIGGLTSQGAATGGPAAGASPSQTAMNIGK